VPRSVIDIDVHDEKWKKFTESFKDYQDSTAKLNEVWKHFDVAVNKPRMATEALDKAIGRAHKSSEAMAKTWAKVGESIGHSDKKLSRFERTIHGVERGLSRVARIGLSLGKFALAAGGIGFAGGLFGMDLLANSAMQRQKTARGLGMPIGQVSAFKTYMEPYLANPAGTLAAIINARRTTQGMAALSALGFQPNEYDNPNLNRMKFSEQVAERVRSLYLNARRNEPNVPIESILKAYHVQALGFSAEDARRLANTPQAQLRASFGHMAGAARQLQVPERLATEWANLSVQLKRAGIAIETALTDRLAKLAPLIGTMSADIVKFIDRFVNSKEVGRVITDIANGLKSFDQFLESDKFKKDMDTLGDSAMVAARDVLKLGSFIAAFLGSPAIKIIKDTFGLENKMMKLYDEGGHELFPGKKKEAASKQWNKRHGLIPHPENKRHGLIPHPENKRHGLIQKSGFYTNPHDWRWFNNPGNIDPTINGVRVYREFPSMAAGYQAMARTVQGYGENTVSQIVRTYEGKNAPNLADHISAIAKWMHVGRNEKLNLRNTDTLSHLVTDLAEFEHPHHRNRRQLYDTVRDAIIEGMKSVTFNVTSGAGARIATSMHAAKY